MKNVYMIKVISQNIKYKHIRKINNIIDVYKVESEIGW